MVDDADCGFYGRGQWDFLQKGIVAVRGGILELAGIRAGGSHMESRYDNFEDPSSDAKLFLYALKEFKNFQHDSFKEYMEMYSKRNSSLRWSKQFYLDQRISGWLSYIELGLDLLDGDSLHLGNSEYSINLMLSLPLKNMKVKGFHIDEIKSNNESLLTIPFNQNRTIDKITSGVISSMSRFLGSKLITKIFH